MHNSVNMVKRKAIDTIKYHTSILYRSLTTRPVTPCRKAAKHSTQESQEVGTHHPANIIIYIVPQKLHQAQTA